MLSCIKLVLRPYPKIKEIEDASWVISNFLGPPPNMTLEEACSTGRVRLLDWIWASSCTSEADRVAQWTLTNYLRSDPRYYRYQFSQSMDTAAGRGELEVVRWLFSHFSGCEAPVGVVGAAVKAGHLSVVQLLWTLFSEARHTGKECTSDCVIIDDKGRILDEKLYGEFFERGGSDDIVCWADRIVLLAAENGHCDMVRWLCENTVEEQERRGDNYYQVMKHVLKLGSDDLFKVLLPPGRCVLDYAKGCPRKEIVQLMLDCGYLRRDADAAVAAIKDLAGGGHLELMQQIALLHPLLQAECLPCFPQCWVANWRIALTDSCKSGHLECVKWLFQHPMRIRVIELIRKRGFHNDIISSAAGEGHWKVVQYLCEKRFTNDYFPPLELAIRNGHVQCVEVLLRLIIKKKTQWPHEYPIDIAAQHGQLEVVQFLWKFRPHGVNQGREESSFDDAWWSQSHNVALWAARSGNLELVKWLHINGIESWGKCVMDAAAGAGHLHIVKWLHYNRNEGCTKWAMHAAAEHGHLRVVQWLHSNRDEGCTRDTLHAAAKTKHFDVVKWLHTNKRELRTYAPNAMVHDIFCYGDLRIVSWAHSQFPEHTPKELNEVLRIWETCKFETLLFLDAHSPQCIDMQSAEEIRDRIRSCSSSGERRRLLEWQISKLPEKRRRWQELNVS